jgi:histidine phosphotransferase ChpT
MTTKLDIDLLQLIASKICHDLISPIGAVNNGVEFMEEMGADSFDDAIGLIAHSAKSASAKLQAYRIAYGAGGADSHVRPEDVKKSIGEMIEGDGKVTQNWEADPNMAIPEDHYERPVAYCKILACCLLQALDCMPKGGVLSVSVEGEKTTVTAKGENAAFRERIIDALGLKLDNSVLDPKHMHAVITGMLMQHYGYDFECDSETGQISISFFKT